MGDCRLGCGGRGDSVPLRSTPAPPTVRLVHSVNGQPAGPSPCPRPGVDKPPGPHIPACNPPSAVTTNRLISSIIRNSPRSKIERGLLYNTLSISYLSVTEKSSGGVCLDEEWRPGLGRQRAGPPIGLSCPRSGRRSWHPATIPHLLPARPAPTRKYGSGCGRRDR